jgi:hypothetical protein
MTHSPYARAPDLTVTLSRIAVQYLTLIFHQHTEAKDVITSKTYDWNLVKAWEVKKVMRWFRTIIRTSKCYLAEEPDLPVFVVDVHLFM